MFREVCPAPGDKCLLRDRQVASTMPRHHWPHCSQKEEKVGGKRAFIIGHILV